MVKAVVGRGVEEALFAAPLPQRRLQTRHIEIGEHMPVHVGDGQAQRGEPVQLGAGFPQHLLRGRRGPLQPEAGLMKVARLIQQGGDRLRRREGLPLEAVPLGVDRQVQPQIHLACPGRQRFGAGLDLTAHCHAGDIAHQVPGGECLQDRGVGRVRRTEIIGPGDENFVDTTASFCYDQYSKPAFKAF